ncbi:MAG: DNA gyrase inhibitor YacG [Phycisphaerae bacterium]|nr:DNA gyrase inhibitor YacG [Phycisphaerae bacterium]
MPTFTCPTCGSTLTVPRREDAPYRPFCSYRCKMIDLHKWFDEQYRISEPLDAPADTPDSAPPPRDPDEE